MLAGFAATDITPSVGTPLNGFIARLSHSTGIDSPLAARALWLEKDETRLLIIGLDVLGITTAFADRMVEELAARLDVPKSNIVLACSHTHSGPMTAPLRGVGPEDEDYLAQLALRIREASIDAVAKKHPVEVLWGSAPMQLAINRRQIMPKDGKAVLGHNPDGPHETTVRVLQLEGKGNPILLFHYTCHPYFLRSDSSLISSDYFGHAAAELQKNGFDSIYLNGCAGDQGPLPGEFGPQAARRSGRKLADAVLKAAENARVDEEPVLQAGSQHFELPHDTLDDLEQIESDLAKADRTVRSDERGYMIVQERLKTAWRQWFEQLTRAVRTKGGLAPLPVRISVARIGRGTIVALPGEVFFDLGRRIAAGLAGDPLCVAAYCHGYIGYVPDVEAMSTGGYEVEESHRYVGIWRVGRRAEDILTTQANTIWNNLKGFPQ